jgi:predicted ATP-dependent serine protease
LRRAWLRSARFTCTQLGAAFLVRRAQNARMGAEPFTLDECTDTIAAEARALVEQGRQVDRRLLTTRGARERVRGFLAFAAQRGYIQRADRGRWRATPGDLTVNVPAWDVGYRDFPLGYAWNEYNEMGAVSEPLALPGAG